MKLNKSTLWALGAMIVVAAVYRSIPGRPWGFTPQIAMGIFGGAVIKDKKWAFALPIFSMFLSDLLYQLLYKAGVTSIYGFYSGQWVNYVLVALMVFIGMMITRITVLSVAAASVIAPLVFFLISNFTTWSGLAGLRGLNRPFTFNGLMLAYQDGLPFLPGSILGTVFFCAVLFGGYYFFVQRGTVVREKTLA